MKEGLSIFKLQLDQERNKRQPTDKRQIQRDLIHLKKDGFVYLDRIQEKKVELLNFDECLQKLNPHQYQKTEQLNKQILQVQILGGVKQPEELEKFDSFINTKANQKYQEQIGLLSNGNEFQRNHHYFLDGKRREENIKVTEEEKAYVKLHRFGVQLSALKSNPKYVYNPQPEEGQQQPEENQQQAPESEAPQTQIKESKAPSLVVTAQELEPELSTQFLTVFKNDSMLKKEKIRDLFPQVNFETLTLDKKFDLTSLKDDQPIESKITKLKINKVKFNPVIKQIHYEPEQDLDENKGSVFARIDEFNESLQRKYQKDKVIEKQIELQTTEEQQEQKWSQNQFDYLDKIMSQLKTQNQIKNEEKFNHSEQNNEHNPKFNNVNLTTTVKYKPENIKGHNKGQSISDSLGKLQNLKFHQYETARDLEIVDQKPKDFSEIEQLQVKTQKVEEQYFDQDLEDDQVYQKYKKDMSKLQSEVDQRGNEIFSGVEHLYRQYNSNQFDQQFAQIAPNFNGVTKLDFDKVKEQFRVIPQKQKKFTEQQKEQFSKFYANIQEPLDLLHKITDTYQQAREKEQEFLDNQLAQQSLFQIGTIPKPQFFSNKYDYYKKDNEKIIYKSIGNQHQDFKTMDKDLQKRFRYQNILSNLDDAKEKFKYNLND